MTQRTLPTLAAASLIAIVSAAPAQAALTQVTVRIEGRTKTLFEGPILSEGHDVSSYKADGGSESEDLAAHSCDAVSPDDPENTAPADTPTAAAVDAMNTIGESDALAGEWDAGLGDYFVEQWGREAENAESGGSAWGLLINNVFTSVGGCQYELGAGDEVLWIYNAFESRPILGLFAVGEHYSSGTRPLTATAQLNEAFELEVAAYAGHGEGEPPATPERTSANTTPYEGAEVAPVATSEQGFEMVMRTSSETVTTNGEGKASIVFTTPGWHRLMAGAPLDAKGEETAIRSNRLDVCVTAPGQSGCGEPPSEDQLRTPPRYLHPSEGAPAEHPPSAPSASPGAGVSGAPPAQSSPAVATLRSPLAGLDIIGDELELDFSAAGVVTIDFARQSGHGRHRHWHVARRLTVHAKRRGSVRIRLPRLSPGVYRVSNAAPEAGSVVRMLTVSHARR